MTQSSTPAAPILRHYVTQDGLTLIADDYPPAFAREAPPIFCLHGLTRNARDFTEFAHLCQSEGFRVIAWDTRGRGRSSYDPDPGHYHVSQYAMDAFGFLASLQIKRAIWVGNSMGGLITMLAAKFTMAPMAGVILNDIAPILGPEALAGIVAAVKAYRRFDDWPDAVAFARSRNEAAFPGRDADFWDRFARRVFLEDPDASPAETKDADGSVPRFALAYDPAIAQLFETAPAPQSDPPADPWDLFEPLRQLPYLMVVRGALSGLLSSATLDEMHVRAPQLQSVTVPDIGHHPFLVEPEAWPRIRELLLAIPAEG